MKSKLKNITYLVISLLITLYFSNTLLFNNGAQTELSIPKQSAGYSESFIHVDGSVPNNEIIIGGIFNINPTSRR